MDGPTGQMQVDGVSEDAVDGVRDFTRPGSGGIGLRRGERDDDHLPGGQE